MTAIAVHPQDPATAYVGTAQGGLYRTLNGGGTWTQLMDNATPGLAGTPLAIGSVAIDPTDPSTVLVGTGEGNLSGDSFFGVGLYIITDADTSSPIVHGPYNMRESDGADIFTGRSIVGIAIDPADHNHVFFATSSGVGGIIPTTYSTLPPRGLYRTTNAFAGINATGTPLFRKLTIEPSEDNEIVTSVVIEPDNANNLVCAVYSQNGTHTGGIYRTANALSTTPEPTFMRSKPLPDQINVKLAIQKGGAGGELTTLYAATEEGRPNGRLYKSINGGITFGPALRAANGFAGAQGFYDIAVAVHPADPQKIYLGGNTGRNIFLYSNNGGQTFESSVIGLHADTHAIAVAPSSPTTIYHGNDGGIWRSGNAGLNWLSLNNATFSATQFQDLAVHPRDGLFSIGGTQDNGTEFLKPDGSIRRADFGDGGYSLIDQNAVNNRDVTMYHTYFNLTGAVIGTARVLDVACATEGNWSFHGAFDGRAAGPFCDGSFDTHNGISISDQVNFYAPQALGPGKPNTWYFGTDKLYRSLDRADTATVASQLLDRGVPVSAIAISRQEDDVRVVGLDNGKVFATTTGAPFLAQIAGPGATRGTSGTPAQPVGRIAIDPNNSSVAYLCFGGYGDPASPMAHVWKTTDLKSPFVTFTAFSKGLPDVPVNAITVDPASLKKGESRDIYVGTDLGVYYSSNGGSTWVEYGKGFPRAAVFGLEIQDSARLIRAATHGRGLYQAAAIAAATPTPTPGPGADLSTKLLNVSTRGPVQAGDDVMIAGFIVRGASKELVIRGIGPSLTRLGVVNAIDNPTLSLRDANGSLLGYNDDYTGAPASQRAVLSANELTPSDRRESAIARTLAPGAYTAILRGKANGNGLVEVYDVSPTAGGRLVNISTRCNVGHGDNEAMIAGFIIGAPENEPPIAQHVVLRALGPSLKQAGLFGTLADTTLDLYRGSDLILSNDNWNSNSAGDRRTLESHGLAPQSTDEAALATTLDAGSYSAVVRGKDNTTGVALVEVYQLP